MDTPTFNTLLGYATVLAQVATVGLFVLWLRDRSRGTRDAFTGWVSTNALWLAAAVAVGASAGSLVLSDVIGYEPCVLCWYQRIFLYPQAVILAMAAWARDTRILRYALALCLVGGLIALDHVWLQMGHGSLIPCSATGPSCGQRFIFEFGYVTIPVMSLTAFALIASLLAHAIPLPRRR